MVKEELSTIYNYKRAIEAIHDLEESIKKCGPRTPQLSGVSVRFIEGAFYKEEIDEQDHNMLLDRVATANDKFFHDCGCKVLSFANA